MAVRFRYLGWTAFEITMDDGFRILLDPMLAGRPAEGVPPAPVGVEAFDGVNLVLVTHVAADHVGQAFDILKRSQAQLVCDYCTRVKALAAGIAADRIFGMLSGVRFAIERTFVKALPAIHASFSQLGENQFISCQPLSYLIEAPTGERIFFGGDTSITSDHRLFGELYRPDVAMLGVGGVDAHGQSFTELYPDEAAMVAKWLGVKVAFPMHYRFHEGEEFVKELRRRAPRAKAILLKPGQTYIFQGTRAPRGARPAPRAGARR
jgi:L-ascorbate metabolism protein UlaG (beta-lactamase superfamily)